MMTKLTEAINRHIDDVCSGKTNETANPSERFKPVGTVLFFEQGGRLHIRHANGHEYVCVVGDKFAEIIRNGIVSAGEQFDCAGSDVYRHDVTVTF